MAEQAEVCAPFKENGRMLVRCNTFSVEITTTKLSTSFSQCAQTLLKFNIHIERLFDGVKMKTFLVCWDVLFTWTSHAEVWPAVGWAKKTKMRWSSKQQYKARLWDEFWTNWQDKVREWWQWHGEVLLYTWLFSSKWWTAWPSFCVRTSRGHAIEERRHGSNTYIIKLR